MLIQYYLSHDPRGQPTFASRRLLRNMAAWHKITVRDVIVRLRAGDVLRTPNYRYMWTEEYASYEKR